MKIKFKQFLKEQDEFDDPFGEELSNNDRRRNMDWKMEMGDKVEINGLDKHDNEIIEIGTIGIVRSSGSGSNGRFGYVWVGDEEKGAWYYQKDLLLINKYQT